MSPNIDTPTQVPDNTVNFDKDSKTVEADGGVIEIVASIGTGDYLSINIIDSCVGSNPH